MLLTLPFFSCPYASTPTPRPQKTMVVKTAKKAAAVSGAKKAKKGAEPVKAAPPPAEVRGSGQREERGGERHAGETVAGRSRGRAGEPGLQPPGPCARVRPPRCPGLGSMAVRGHGLSIECEARAGQVDARSRRLPTQAALRGVGLSLSLQPRPAA